MDETFSKRRGSAPRMVVVLWTAVVTGSLSNAHSLQQQFTSSNSSDELLLLQQQPPPFLLPYIIVIDTRRTTASLGITAIAHVRGDDDNGLSCNQDCPHVSLVFFLLQ